MARIDYYGTDEIIQKLDRLGADVSKELAKALIQSAEKPKREMLAYISQHRVTGDTERSFTETIKEDTAKGKIYLDIGFNLSKKDGSPGLPALFLNYGTPFIEPSFFIDNAIENNRDEIKRVQQETLEKVAREIGLK